MTGSDTLTFSPRTYPEPRMVRIVSSQEFLKWHEETQTQRVLSTEHFSGPEHSQVCVLIPLREKVERGEILKEVWETEGSWWKGLSKPVFLSKGSLKIERGDDMTVCQDVVTSVGTPFRRCLFCLFFLLP